MLVITSLVQGISCSLPDAFPQKIVWSYSVKLLNERTCRESKDDAGVYTHK
jgi:hypothetical protein